MISIVTFAIITCVDSMNQIPTATLLVSDTHQDEQAQAVFAALAQKLAVKLGQHVVACALDHPAETIWHALTGLLQQGYVKIVIIPLFLTPSEVRENVIGDAVAFANGRWPHAHFHLSPLPSWDEWLQMLQAKLQDETKLEAVAPDKTAIILAGQGGDNAQINSDLAKQARLLADMDQFAWVDVAFIAHAKPEVGELIANYQTLGAEQIVIVPWLLFSGAIFDDLTHQVNLVGKEVQVDLRLTNPLTDQDAIIGLLSARQEAALEDRSLLPVSWRQLQWQIASEMDAEHKRRPGTAPADEVAFQKILRQIDNMLPPRYQGKVDPVLKKTIARPEIIVSKSGSVQWKKMFGLDDNQIGELALAGGLSTSNELLEAVNPEDCTNQWERYGAVLQQIGAGIQSVTGLKIVESHTHGWIGVQCDSEEMAIWLVRAIIVENVMVRREGDVLFLPAGPHFSLNDEILVVVSVVVKTWRFWIEHITAKQWQEAEGNNHYSMSGDSGKIE